MIIRVRNYHIDGYGHLNNARYLEFLEEARWTFFEQHNLLPQLKDILLVVARIDIRYRHPAIEGNELHIHSEIKELYTRHLILNQNIELTHNQKSAATAAITLMPVHAITGHSMRFPDNLFYSLQTLLPQ